MMTRKERPTQTYSDKYRKAVKIANAMNHWFEYRDGHTTTLDGYTKPSCGAVTVDEVLHMEPIERDETGFHVYARQWGDVTILVLVSSDGNVRCQCNCW